MHHLVQFFGIVDVIGSGYHPQAQGAVERPHREYNKICREFMHDVTDWHLMAPIFVWQIRTTAKLFNGRYSPYEIVTGMKPRSPVDAIINLKVPADQITRDQYVLELVKYVKNVHRFVDEQHRLTRDKENSAKLREFGPGSEVSVGDYCLVKKAPVTGISERFQTKHFESLFQVVEIHGDDGPAKTYTVCDLAGNRTGLGFSQPLAGDRLLPVDYLAMGPLPFGEEQPTRIAIRDGSQDRHGTVVNQSLDGKVYIKFDGSEESRCYDLSRTRYRWLSNREEPSPPVPAPGT